MATDIPVNGDGTYDEATWAEGGTYGATAYEGNGIPDGTILDENTINTPRKHYGRWIRALRDRMYPSDYGLMASCMIKAGTWNVAGGTLDGTLSATWMILDADDDGGVVVQFSLSAGSPKTFTANSTTYVALNEAGDDEYSVGTPVAISGYVNVWTVVTDATEITAATVLIPTVPTFKSIGAEGIDVEGTVDVDGDIDVSGSGRVLIVSGGGTTGGSPAAYISGGIGPSLEVESTSPTDAAIKTTNSGGGLGLLVDDGGATIKGSTTIGEAGDTHQFNGDVTFNNTLTANGDVAIGTDSGDALNVLSSVIFASPVDFNGDVDIGDVTDTVRINAKLGTSIDMDTHPLFNVTMMELTGGFSLSAPGQLAANADGDLQFRATTTTHYVHTSAKGNVWAVGDSESDLITGITSGSSLDLSQAQVTPKATGYVEVTVSGWLTWSADGGSTTVQLRDATDDTTINGGGFGVVAYPIFNVTDTARRPNGFHVAVKYALPNTDPRTFEVRLTSAGATTTYSDVTVSVRGVG